MTEGIDRRVAAGIVEDALAAVFDPGVVRQLREDSPLSILGMTTADAVCISDAVAGVAASSGLACHLGDTDLAGVGTVADLVGAVQARAQRRVEGA